MCEVRPVPWVKAILRGQKVYARADEKGALAPENGRVEVRYKPNDGRRYLARADPTPLPDETCGPADAVQKPDAGAGKAAGGAKGKGASGSHGAAHPPGAVIAYAD